MNDRFAPGAAGGEYFRGSKVFATTDAAETWFGENDPEGVAFEYEVLGEQP
jgi:hypothetical protein